MLRLLLLLVVLLASPTIATAAPPDAVLKAQKDRIEAIAKASQSFVAVFANEGNGGGSGVVISPDGYALTNFHVAKPAGNHMKCGMNDGQLYDAILVGLDPTGDIALIKLLGREDFVPARLADSDKLAVGDWCFAVGNPFLLATDFQPTVTYGLVSGLHRCQYPAGTLLEYTDAIQTDASINPGNSGGPLFSAAGELIGIVGSGSFDKRGRVNVGVGYAISINQVKNFLGSLKAGRLVDHATLGATVSTDAKGRVLVNNILEESDAFRRGLRYNDEIVRFGGREISSANGFKSVLGMFPKGWRVPLTYRRDGKEKLIDVRLAGLLTPEQLNDKATKAFGEDSPKPKPPKPGEKPKDDKPKEESPDEPHANQSVAPAEIAALIDPRPGFANFHFNRLGRDRVWKSIAAAQAYPKDPWHFTGKLSGGSAIEIKLGDNASEGTFPSGNLTLDLAKDFDQQLDPPSSGGLLAALHLWRKLMLDGPDKFGEVYYYGTRPLKLGGKAYEVLVATQNVAELEIYSDPSTGEIARVEFFVDDDLDPCELHFKSQGRIEVWHADSLFATLELTSEPTAKPAGDSP